MRCPTLSELPPPPPEKNGWPWTEESPQMPAVLPNGCSWPMVSIVTPSFNQAQFVEETIRSVLLQGFPNLEYIFIDGGSTDGTLDIVKKYEHWLIWVSEQDDGQSDAINKGWGKSRGEVITWINSDDFYSPNALRLVMEKFICSTESDFICGDCNCVNAQSRNLGILRSSNFDLRRQMTGRNQILQPSTFFRRKILDQIGVLDVSLQYVMDYDFWVRALIAGSTMQHIPEMFSNYRIHHHAKSIASQLSLWLEIKKVLDQIYQSNATPVKIRRWKGRAYSNFHLSCGEIYLMLRNLAMAREEFWQAFFYNPFRPASFIIFAYILDTWVGGNRFGIAIKRFLWRLQNGFDDRLLWDDLIQDYSI